MGKALGIYLQAEFPYASDTKEQAKAAVREWLKHVDLPEMGTMEMARRLLEVLVDEPE